MGFKLPSASRLPRAMNGAPDDRAASTGEAEILKTVHIVGIERRRISEKKRKQTVFYKLHCRSEHRQWIVHKRYSDVRTLAPWYRREAPLRAACPRAGWYG